jgi:DNA-binding PucR family transcriptional regulator
MSVAIREVLDGGLAAIERGVVGDAPMPPAMIAQARRAARIGVGLDTILRRYIAGHTLLDGYIMEEGATLPTGALGPTQRLLRSWLDRLVESIATEYKEERERLERADELRALEAVKRLLDGSTVAMSELAYPLTGWHVGLIARGLGAIELVRTLASRLGRELLEIPLTHETVWAWLGGTRAITFAEIEQAVPTGALSSLSVGVGEPAEGLDGWRLTHRQAQDALHVALHRPGRLVRYADELLVASALADETLRRSLTQVYIEPFRNDRDRGAGARDTARAFFAARGNVATAAHMLGVDRHTVERRLRRIENRLGRPISSCGPELELALRLEALPDA